MWKLLAKLYAWESIWGNRSLLHVIMAFKDSGLQSYKILLHWNKGMQKIGKTWLTPETRHVPASCGTSLAFTKTRKCLYIFIYLSFCLFIYVMSKCVCCLLCRHYKIFTFILMHDIVSWSRCHGITTLSVKDSVSNFFFSYRNTCGSSNVAFFPTCWVCKCRRKRCIFRPELDYVVIHSKVLSPTEVVANFRLNNDY